MSVKSKEAILQEIYDRIESQYHFTGKEVQLDVLQDVMVTLEKIGADNMDLYNDGYIKRWYHGE